MRVCPGCRTSYDESVPTCPHDGLPLLEVSRTFAKLQQGDPALEQVQELDLSEEADVAVTPGMMVGEYMVERTIAEGGMGAIYAGIHPVISKRVAIKVIAKRYAADPKAVARFVLEARSVNQIGHHNIVDIFSIGELDDRRNYLVMELLDGLALSQILLKAKRLKPGEVLPVYEQLCDALDAAHKKGFIHRDLKPDNIIVLRRPPRPFIKILDFGLAKLRGALVSNNTEVGTVLGTPEYMAPEQCRGAPVDARTDIYALGVMLFELVTGQKPFTDPSPLRILTMHQHQAPTPPSKLAPIGKRLELVILRAMAKDPATRYASTMELVDDLRRAVPEALPWSAELVSWTKTAPKPAPPPPAEDDEPAEPRAVVLGDQVPDEQALPRLAPVSISGEMGPISEEFEDDNLETLVSEPKAHRREPGPRAPEVEAKPGAPEVKEPPPPVPRPLPEAISGEVPDEETEDEVPTELEELELPEAAKPEPRPAAKPEPRAAAKPEARAAAKPEPRPAAKPEARAAAKPEPRPPEDATPEARAAAKPEPRRPEAAKPDARRADGSKPFTPSEPEPAFSTPPRDEVSDMAESTLVDDQGPVVLVDRPILEERTGDSQELELVDLPPAELLRRKETAPGEAGTARTPTPPKPIPAAPRATAAKPPEPTPPPPPFSRDVVTGPGVRDELGRARTIPASDLRAEELPVAPAPVAAAPALPATFPPLSPPTDPGLKQDARGRRMTGANAVEKASARKAPPPPGLNVGRLVIIALIASAVAAAIVLAIKFLR